jgi:hypothetical protein
MTAYDPLMPEKLTGFGVFDEMYSDDVEDLKTPKNMQDIVHAITSLQNDNTTKFSLARSIELGLRR